MQLEKRTIVVGLVWNKNDELLFCKMPDNRGVFPSKWGLPGGGIEPNEKMENALHREIKEEVGIEVEKVEPAFFKDGEYTKTFEDGSKRSVYMIFLLFNCRAKSENLKLNEEFIEYKWVKQEDFKMLDLNIETIDTLKQLDKW